MPSYLRRSRSCMRLARLQLECWRFHAIQRISYDQVQTPYQDMGKEGQACSPMCKSTIYDYPMSLSTRE